MKKLDLYLLLSQPIQTILDIYFHPKYFLTDDVMSCLYTIRNEYANCILRIYGQLDKILLDDSDIPF